MPLKKKTKKVEQPVVQESEGDLMDCFHSENICEIFRLNTYKKPISFTEYRPKKKKDYLDYNISRTETKMDAGPTKIHYQETQVKYEPYPPEIVAEKEQVLPKPKRKKKPPSKGREKAVWVFEDEKRAAKIERLQQKARIELRERLLKKFRSRRYEYNFLYLLLYSPEERARRRLLKKMDYNN